MHESPRFDGMRLPHAALTLLILAILIGATLAASTPAYAAASERPLAQDAQPDPTSPLRTAQSYAVGWAALALINAGLAQGKNRSGLIWFLLSIFLGPVATFLLVAFFPKVRSFQDAAA